MRWTATGGRVGVGEKVRCLKRSSKTFWCYFAYFFLCLVIVCLCARVCCEWLFCCARVFCTESEIVSMSCVNFLFLVGNSLTQFNIGNQYFGTYNYFSHGHQMYSNLVSSFLFFTSSRAPRNFTIFIFIFIFILHLVRFLPPDSPTCIHPRSKCWRSGASKQASNKQTEKEKLVKIRYFISFISISWLITAILCHSIPYIANLA